MFKGEALVSSQSAELVADAVKQVTGTEGMYKSDICQGPHVIKLKSQLCQP